MKRSILFSAIFFMCSSFSLFAQKGFHLGVNGSLNSVFAVDKNKYGDADYDGQIKLAPIYGIAAGNRFTDMLGIQIEVNKATLGGKYSFTDDGMDGTKELTLNYFQVPVLFEVTGGDFHSRFSAMFGPQFSFLTGATLEQSGTSFVESSAKVKDMFKKSDVGLLMTAGGDISVGKNVYLNMALRLYYGLSNINESPIVIETRKPDAEKFNNMYAGINIGLHYMFRKEE